MMRRLLGGRGGCPAMRMFRAFGSVDPVEAEILRSDGNLFDLLNSPLAICCVGRVLERGKTALSEDDRARIANTLFNVVRYDPVGLRDKLEGGLKGVGLWDNADGSKSGIRRAIEFADATLSTGSPATEARVQAALASEQPGQIVEALLARLDDPARVRKMRGNGKEPVLNHLLYTADQTLQRYTYYDDVDARLRLQRGASARDVQMQLLAAVDHDSVEDFHDVYSLGVLEHLHQGSGIDVRGHHHALRVLDNTRQALKDDKALYFQQMASQPRLILAKLFDRVHNMGSMDGAFYTQKVNTRDVQGRRQKRLAGGKALVNLARFHADNLQQADKSWDPGSDNNVQDYREWRVFARAAQVGEDMVTFLRLYLDLPEAQLAPADGSRPNGNGKTVRAPSMETQPTL